MKLVLAWLTVLGLAAITAGSCSIDHRTGDFECTKQADCTGGRTCTGGYCVLPGGAIDAPKGDGPVGPLPDSNNNLCPPQCTSCNFGEHTCRIDCAITSCNAKVVCPAGWNCDVACTTANSCRMGVACAPTGTCNIACTGNGSCRSLECGSGKCDITCSGSQSCRGVACDNSCGCDVKCGIQATCEAVACPAPQCDTGLGCSSALVPSCNTCQ